MRRKKRLVFSWLLLLPALLYVAVAERASWRPRIWHIQGGHIVALAASPNGKWLAVGICQPPTFIYNTGANGGRTWTLSAVTRFRSRPATNTIQLWDTAGARVVDTIPCHFEATDVAFSPDNTLLAIATDPYILLWDMLHHRRLWTLPGSGPVRFSPDGKRLITLNKDMINIQFINLAKGRVSWQTGLPTGLATAGLSDQPDWMLAFPVVVTTQITTRSSYRTLCTVAPDEHTAAGVVDIPPGYASEARLLPLHKAASSQERPQVPLPPLTTNSILSEVVTALTFSPDGQWLAVGGDNVRLYDAKTGALRAVCEHSHSCEALAFAPDSQTLAGSCNHQLLLWQSSNGKLLRTIETPKPVAQNGKRGAAFLAFSGDGRTLFAGYDSDTVKLWRMK
ncbi:MAG: WD40 repeat domain-containing protein [Abitibacteriaceae bacterium]|nr:WD40 repeat domain-containing protein [Abditibacteriaceae bacterium]MBV9867945.1 WD40 repeat domain-containing protein [Abditibacteriaceae bacterium]